MKIYIFVLIALSFSCKSSKVESTISDSDRITINNALGENWSDERSPENNYLLAVQDKESDPKQPVLEKKFVVLDSNGNQIYNGQINGGYVKWFSETKIEYYNYVGIMPRDADKDEFISIYDVVEKTTVKKSELK